MLQYARLPPIPCSRAESWRTVDTYKSARPHRAVERPVWMFFGEFVRILELMIETDSTLVDGAFPWAVRYRFRTPKFLIAFRLKNRS